MLNIKEELDLDITVKKKTTWNGKVKNLCFNEGKIVDENGEIVDIMDILEQFYGDKVFEIAVSAKEEEELEYEEELVL